MNKLDKDYLELVNDIISNGYDSGDRTGTGTRKVFGREIRHKMSDGFPLLTTKKMFHKGIFHELLWFLKGDTNIKYLVDNGVNIWVGDCYKKYLQEFNKSFKENETLTDFNVIAKPLTQSEFIEMIKTDEYFSKQWAELGPSYGQQWRNWKTYDKVEVVPGNHDHNYYKLGNTIDQISDLIEMLKTNPDGRRMMVSAWNIEAIPHVVLPPCHYGFQVFTRLLNSYERENIYAERRGYTEEQRYEMNPNATDEEVHVLMNMDNIPTRAISLKFSQRSVDVGLGLPFNIASYGLLLEMLGHCVNMVPEELIASLGDTHIYQNQIEPIKEQLDREPLPLCKLRLSPFSKNIFEIKFEDLEVLDYTSHDKINLPLSN